MEERIVYTLSYVIWADTTPIYGSLENTETEIHLPDIFQKL